MAVAAATKIVRKWKKIFFFLLEETAFFLDVGTDIHISNAALCTSIHPYVPLSLLVLCIHFLV